VGIQRHHDRGRWRSLFERGFGVWEFFFTALVTFCAFRGLGSYNWIGAGWLLHTGWDVLHHLYGNPIVPFVAGSSLGCAICAPVIVLWCFAGAPSVYEVPRISRTRRPNPRP
jgi:hypothetical protein